MSVVFAVTFKAKDETYDQLHATLTAILPDTAKFEGAELISCSADPADKTFYIHEVWESCLLYTSPSPRDQRGSRMPSSA